MTQSPLGCQERSAFRTRALTFRGRPKGQVGRPSVSPCLKMTGASKWGRRQQDEEMTPSATVFKDIPKISRDVQLGKPNSNTVHCLCTHRNSSGSWMILVQAKLVLVVEKDTVFQHLLHSGLLSILPLILVTGRGYPDVLTRRFLQKLQRMAPELPQLYLGDYDPDGVAIYMLYLNSCQQLQLDQNLFCLGDFSRNKY